MSQPKLRTKDQVPVLRWLALSGVAVVGSMIFGASLSHRLPALEFWKAAVWLTIGAGSAWLVFGPLLLVVTRIRLFAAIDACLVTMAWGEAVLVTGSLGNWWGLPVSPVPYNIGVVAVSNVVMCTVLARQLAPLGVPFWKTVATWILGLNGTGVFTFWMSYRLLFEGWR
jgi:hypothetical protein